MANIQFTVKSKTVKGESYLEGSYQLPNSTVTKLARKDGSTLFPNGSSLKATAKRLATTLGREAEFSEPAKKAAKKSVKKATKKAAPAATTTCTQQS